jgi:RimJ/RimL family protein N-acetyltransferase
MAFFPELQDASVCLSFIHRMQDSFKQKNYCYFAVELLEAPGLLGFIGLNEVDSSLDFSPAVDIGWRLKKEHWHRGLATEGAVRCLAYAFKELQLEEVISIAPSVNLPSIKVMEKIGMKHVRSFVHPKLANVPHLHSCELYVKRGNEP